MSKEVFEFQHIFDEKGDRGFFNRCSHIDVWAIVGEERIKSGSIIRYCGEENDDCNIWFIPTAELMFDAIDMITIVEKLMEIKQEWSRWDEEWDEEEGETKYTLKERNISNGDKRD